MATLDLEFSAIDNNLAWWQILQLWFTVCCDFKFQVVTLGCSYSTNKKIRQLVAMNIRPKF